MLRVLVDGKALPDEEARAFWGRFSAYMDAHKGDLAGFAKEEGFASVHPETHGGDPTLVASRTAPQKAYANAPQKPGGAGGGGSRPSQGKKDRGPSPPRGGGKDRGRRG